MTYHTLVYARRQTIFGPQCGLLEDLTTAFSSFAANHQASTAAQWAHLIMTMRTADRLVLHQALQKYMVAVAQEWVELYRLSLNDCVLFIRGDDLDHFCALVQGAVERFPRRTVRWADLQVQLTPYAADGLPDIGCFPLTNFGSVVAGWRLGKAELKLVCTHAVFIGKATEEEISHDDKSNDPNRHQNQWHSREEQDRQDASNQYRSRPRTAGRDRGAL